MGATHGPETGERRELIATEAGRIDAILAAAYSDLSRARVQRLIADGLVHVNGEPVRKSGQVMPGARIALDLPVTPHESVETGLAFAALYEDADLIAIDKPPGVSVHGAPGDTTPTVALWFLERFAKEAEAFDSERPGLVHRLDKDTSGVLVLAKSPAAQAALSHAFEARETRKTYIALTDGVPAHERAVIDAAIGRHRGDRTRMALRKEGREARTEFEVAASNRDHSLLVIKPESGRTHQIRVHLAAISAPVRNDRTYGKGDGSGRQLLHAWQLSIPHPGGGRLTVTAPLPPDMAEEARAFGFEEEAMRYCQPEPARLEGADPGEPSPTSDD